MLIRQGRAFTPSAIPETRILESEEIVVEGAERPNGLRLGVTNVDGRHLLTECRGLRGWCVQRDRHAYRYDRKRFTAWRF